jgi:hypothetical protein
VNTDPGELKIFDQLTGRSLEILELVLVDVASKTHLPEIFSIFGKESFLKFLDVFAGATIHVPQRSVIENAIRDVQIYLILKKASEDSQASLVREMAERYSISTGTVRRKFVEMEERLKRFKFHEYR